MTAEVEEKKPATLKIVIKMEPGRQLKINSFIKLLKGFMGLINECERTTTKRRARIKWKVVNMGRTKDSYFVEIQA